MDFFRKHADTATVLGALLAVCFWIRSDIKSEMTEMRRDVARLDSRLVRIETILFMNNMIPKDLVAMDSKKD